MEVEEEEKNDDREEKDRPIVKEIVNKRVLFTGFINASLSRVLSRGTGSRYRYI